MDAALHVELEWQAVNKVDGSVYRYPAKPSTIAGANSPCPVVYRWVFSPQSSKPEYLVGETGDLKGRLRDYRNGKGKHANEFKQFLEKGTDIRLEALHFPPFTFNGTKFSQEQLKRAFVRGALENLCCAILEDQGFKVHNRTWAE